MDTTDYFHNGFLVPDMVRLVKELGPRIEALKEADGTAIGPISPLLLEGACSDISQRIQVLCDSLAVSRRELLPEMLSEFAYLLAAWADEAIIQSFRGRMPQPYVTSVERLLFGSMLSGEQIFERIDRVLRYQSRHDLLLAPAYLLLISLGFQGKYTGGSNTAALSNVHEQLRLISLKPRVTSMSTETRRATSPLEWTMVVRRLLWPLIGLVFLVVLFVMQFAWISVTKANIGYTEISDQLTRIRCT